MEASRSEESNLSPNRDRRSNPPHNPIISSAQVWPTIDGPLGLTEEASVDYARRFYKFGFALLPWLWAVNCFYFWPVLRHSRAFPQIRNRKFSDYYRYIVELLIIPVVNEFLQKLWVLSVI